MASLLGDVGAAFAAARGFERQDRITFVRAETASYRDLYWELRRGLQQRRHIPANARMVHLAGAPVEQGVRPRTDVIAHHFGSGAYSRNPPASCGDQFAGVLLARLQGDEVLVDAQVVAPRYRKRWTIALLGAAAADVVPESVRWISFSWHEAARDTARLAERVPRTITRVLGFCQQRL